MRKFTRYYDDDKDKESPEQQNKPKHKNVIEYKVKLKAHKFKYESSARKKFQSKVKYDIDPNLKGKASIPKELLFKHSRGEAVNKDRVKTFIHKKKMERKERNIQVANEQAAHAEVLLIEDSGFLEADAGETSTQFTQKQIVKNVDIAAAAKHFELHLNDFGPYRAKYTRNGRHLLLGGKRGHVAAFDWVTKKLHCEINVMEEVYDISWLHIETMFAVAQKDWVYIYDNQGIELHCVKQLHKVCRMEFLPYHFLLATASDMGYLGWLDISIGQIVSRYNTRLGRLTMLTQNPYNAVLCLGHAKGVVSMWAPSTKEPLAKMLCHKAPMTSLHVDPKGTYLATSAIDCSVKVWDIRKLDGPLQSYKMRAPVNNLCFSQKHLLAVGMGNVVEVYKDCCRTATKKAYLTHRFTFLMGNMNFCPFEDVLGVATEKGFTSLLVPGAGEPNYDALEINPYQTKKQRQEAEVKALLEKIQPELITLDPTVISAVDVPTLKDKVEAKKKLLFVKPPKIDYTPRKKAKGRGGAAKISRNKKIVQEQAKKEFIKQVKRTTAISQETKQAKKNESTSVLDRFVTKSKTK